MDEDAPVFSYREDTITAIAPADERVDKTDSEVKSRYIVCIILVG